MTRLHTIVVGAAALLLVGLLLASPSQSAQTKFGPSAADTQKVLDRAIAFLKQAQAADGSYSSKFAGPGITSLVTAGLIRNGVSPKEPVIAKSLAYLEKSTKEDGGVYDKALANYTTAVALMAFKEANTNGKYDAVIKRAADFIKGIQHEEDKSHVAHGGFGYDKKGRPDLSNTGFSVEALLAAGVPKNDPAVERALKFISRCQNLPGETNDQPFAKKTSDDDKGGMTYDPTNPAKSQYATAAGGLRSLGGMTYSGLKSFLYAGVSKDDDRVKAAVAWCRKHYTLEENPGMGANGLYYYYHTFAKAMDALGEEPFVDAKGAKHDWRMELFQALEKRQQQNGSWQGKGFGEEDPNLATAFALLSLSYTKASKR